MKNLYFILSLLLCKIGFAQTSGSVTQGLGTTTTANLMPACSSNHVTPIGTITSTDSKTWIVPSENNFATANKLSDLHNTCNNITPASLAAADLSAVPTTVIDEQGEVITAYIFADNYFELYINGILVGIDAVPFTPFNSSVVKFKVSKPYTIAVRLVDWEENLGLGSEIQSANSLYHPGDGGFIAQFSDGTKTDASWKAQTFYIAPIQDLNTVKELSDGKHSTTTATTTPTCNANCYGIHYDIPSDWTSKTYNDSSWPNAYLYTASQVTNQAAYTNFASTAWSNASFIWSSNLILDNVVLVRKTVNATTSIEEMKHANLFHINNPIENKIVLTSKLSIVDAKLVLSSNTGEEIQEWNKIDINENQEISLQILTELKSGIYFISIKTKNGFDTYKLLKQ
jgi:hypothetical protein